MASRTPDPKVREITDAKVLAAMAHPLRRRLMDQLLVNGPATASTLAEATGSGRLSVQGPTYETHKQLQFVMTR